MLPHYRGVPLLVLTTEASTEKKLEGKAAGATGWVVKPFSPDRLLATIARIVASDKSLPTRERLNEMGQGCQNIDAAQSVAAAVAQMELAVREVRPAVEQLGQLIDALATGLAQLRTARLRDSAPQGVAVFPDSADRLIQELEKSVHGSITQLQFYDRLVQHMSHLQDFLSGVAGNLANDLDWDPNALELLRSKLRVRLISEAQRELLDAVLPPPEGARAISQQAREEHAAQGTVELF